MKRVFSEKKSYHFAKDLAFRMQHFAEGGKIIILEGEMGTGKTTFCRFFLENIGITESSSPSFSLVQVYQNEKTVVVHFDFQRIGTDESISIFEEYEAQYPNAFFLIEWPFDTWKDFFQQTRQAVIHLQFFHGNTIAERIWQIDFYNPQNVSKQQALQLLSDWKTPIHIQKHIEIVRKISVFCAQKLSEANIPIDIDLVENAAILHDAVKYIDFKSFEEKDWQHYQEAITPEKIEFWKNTQKTFAELGHEKAMNNILQKQGFNATGKVIESHRSRKIYEKDAMSWEEKCVYYGDKRAMHDTVVSVEQRLIDGAKRYGHKRNEVFEQLVFDLETELMNAGNWKELDI